ncbi:hypothetical protein HN51_034382 [Arachis hypogaea]|uniref:B box-type domain-containing protein n=2 Tax=Arachis TaxID=3817 RepID=A0A445A8L3_ARAHY|nr:B-box zinc finger protein 20 isoform X1 [Arachis ipaensis]XP_025642390.1 B-box zinc finger protein 20 isoform X1 [Arachis hypogaea]QHN99225.1 B-box zinc finger protein [Arachis hypogaea]RYR22749.1 hypothetical protein Ahy_B03g068053 [Arachis hypogaea]
MKIQCDVCHKVEASFFCPSDEAALCHGCDRTIHCANKVATKHTRFSLHHPNSKDAPLCDICQERRAYIFCQEDRAILCSECDVSIHGANEYTKKHNRFLLTGVKLGAASSSSSSEPTSMSSSRATTSSEAANNQNNNNYYMGSDTGSVSTSSISEYLIETIPGYCMEDLLDASFPPNGFCKEYEQQSLFQDRNNVHHYVSMCSFPLEAWSPSSTPT